MTSMETGPFKPPINLIASDQPTTCPYDGARTDWLSSGKDAGGRYELERCMQCFQRYHVYDS